ncbi:TadA family conjugal transfer-associated ATPase [Saxibacter everestensis]|uniref:TadA family conjugal transfer-associated ATPase n=1 Tax=Saxibacter everestensis TaxID=2909229 RepID=A0ABY8QQ06_9MICO|nr:TadA family conjugal transfer-associated ATPase [Brevibacteriaceae bacterium ZFBP1038]
MSFSSPATLTGPEPDDEWIDAELLQQIRSRLLKETGPVTPAKVAEALRASGKVFGTAAILELVERLSAQISGAGPLQRLLDDPRITDVFVNAPRDVWFDAGEGLQRANITLGGEAEVRALAMRLAATGGRRLDESSPLVDARLPDGVRVNAVIPPISGRYTSLSLRIPRPVAFSLDELVANGTLLPSWRPVLEALISRRKNFLISGGTGAGKTALLGTLLGLVSAHERLIAIEDAPELVISHPHFVQLSARHQNIEGAGEVNQADLVRNAMRMRPDRLVVGECRGAEVRELFTALNTGHEGGCGTVHANTTEDVPARLEALGGLAGLDHDAVAAQACSALDVLVHVRRAGPHRMITHIALLVRDSNRNMAVLDCLERERNVKGDGPPGQHQTRLGPGWVELADLLGLDPRWRRGR